jgi:undecaprenyl-diphosphatase
MSVFEAILLGIIQGATEFLPVSSSAHLVMMPVLLGVDQPSLTLIEIAHLGTLLAVLFYFRRDLLAIVREMLAALRTRRPLGTPDARLGWIILFASIPAGVAGLALKDYFERIFTSPDVAAFCLLITAGLLVFGERSLTGVKTEQTISWLDGLLIGLFQMFALFPGISRSGSTISGGLWRGLNRPGAARFSFLLGIPAILGAGLLGLVDLSQQVGTDGQISVYLAAFAAAGITGYLCIYFLLSWLRRHTLYPFAVYCALLGGGFLLLSFAGVV